MGQLSLQTVTKSFGTIDVVKGVSLDVVEGEFMVFVGPSGCGKSTLLRMIAGLEHTTAGDIVIDGVRVNDMAPVDRGIAMVFQSYALYPHMTVFENIAFPLRVEGLAEAQVRDKVGAAARILHLEDRLQQKPGNLSGGQRQRVAIGRAIVRAPEIFLFDEPLSNLDAALRADMRIELTRLHKQLGATMIYVTHDQIEAMTMADRIVVLHDGYIAQVGAPLELYHTPQTLFVAGFIGNPRMNVLPVTCVGVDATGVTVDLEGQHLHVPVTVPAAARAGLPGQRLSLGIRPEHIALAQGAAADGTAHLRVTPSVIEHLGQQTIGYATDDTAVAGDGGEAVSFCFVLPGTQSIRPDLPVALAFATDDCHLFDAQGRAFARRIDMAGLTLPPMADPATGG
ncbi:carbohydrate ABC transporter ATP-binding protein, CUT1 family [Loktanella fryxellensis]|uniref:Carbohydrate ABC transporter ATP-binding protein, CUT1 family n=1 Tax=Loktanella fryxellensis TaxID=245187 RepID=A0A1H8GYJ7_9RHOB|nr:sn-glycerol-3-phosphate ABC transporter ATP-binding protein UgpC [Loktanella fryxellensis]SEN48829.1 carbohydrate ABC transporter ATP-binding protein, CUT1 family [Loktanella fryxellensis]